MSAQNGPAHRGAFFTAADEPRTKLGGLCPAIFHGFNSMWIVRPFAITGVATELYGDLWAIQTLPVPQGMPPEQLFSGLQSDNNKSGIEQVLSDD